MYRRRKSWRLGKILRANQTKGPSFSRTASLPLMWMSKAGGSSALLLQQFGLPANQAIAMSACVYTGMTRYAEKTYGKVFVCDTAGKQSQACCAGHLSAEAMYQMVEGCCWAGYCLLMIL